MQAIGRPDNLQDPAARRQFIEAMRKAREQMADEMAKDIAEDVLDDKQKAGFKTAATALDEYKKKAKAAQDACQKKLVELLGEDKVLGARRPAPAARPAAPAAQPAKRTEF